MQLRIERCECLYEGHERRPLRMTGQHYKYRTTVKVPEPCEEISFPDKDGWGKGLLRVVLYPGNIECPFFFRDGRLIVKVPNKTEGVISFDFEYRVRFPYHKIHTRMLFRVVEFRERHGTVVFNNIPNIWLYYHVPRWHYFELDKKEGIGISNCEPGRIEQLRATIEREEFSDEEGGLVEWFKIPQVFKGEWVDFKYYVGLSKIAKLWIGAALLLGLLGLGGVIGLGLAGILKCAKGLDIVRDLAIISISTSGMLFAIRTWLLFQYIEALEQKCISWFLLGLCIAILVAFGILGGIICVGV